MERKGSSEKFQPRIVASFNMPQMIQVATWLKREVLNSGTTNQRIFDSVLETVELDEKGKVMDEKSRKRLTYGFATINILHKKGVRLDQVIGTIQVWQVTPDEDKLEIRYRQAQPRNFGLRRF